MNVFEAVKQSVTTRQAAEHYGIHVGRNGMACCPFHNDKTPSMKLDQRYHCFGCGADGDVIDFTAALYGLGKKEAAVQLAQDFGLSYEDWKPPGKAKNPKPRQKSPEEQFQEAKNRCFCILADYLHLLKMKTLKEMKQRLSGKRRAYATTMKILMGIAAGMTAALVLFLIIYVLSKGLPNLSWKLLSTAPSYLSGTIGIWPDILNTLYIVLATILIVVPLGVGAAIYLTEYAAGSRIVAVIEYAAETLSGIPSIIYGLVGMLFFCEFFGMQTSLIAGALTLVIMNLPTVMRTTQESLKTVPQSYREGAFGLGAGKWRVIRTVVLPGCVDGVITGCILSVGRILGESAALLFTAGFGHVLNDFFTAITKPGATLTVALYFYAKEDGEFGVAFAIASILMAMTLLLNIAAGVVTKRFGREKNNE